MAAFEKPVLGEFAKFTAAEAEQPVPLVVGQVAFAQAQVPSSSAVAYRGELIRFDNSSEQRCPRAVSYANGFEVGVG